MGLHLGGTFRLECVSTASDDPPDPDVVPTVHDLNIGL